MLRLPTIGAMATLVLFGANCGESDSGYFPEYFRCEYTFEYLTDFVGKGEGRFVIRRDGLVSIGGRTYQKTVYTFVGLPGEEPAVSYWREASQGILGWWGMPGEGDPEMLFYPFPLEVGATWTKQDQDGVGMDCQIEGEEAVYLPETSYERGLKIVCEYEVGGQITEYRVRGVGSVKVVQRTSDMAYESRLERCE